MQAKNIEVKRNAGSLEINYTWRSPMAYFLLVFCAIWDLAIVAFLFLGAGIFVLIHLLVGAGLTYYTLCLLLNRTEIRVSSADLSVTHGPIPTLHKDHRIPARTVEQLYVQQGGTYKRGNKVTQLYRLSAEVAGGEEIHLLHSLDDEALARATEREIESYLNITDVPRPEPTLNLPDLEEIKERMPNFIRRGIERMEETALARSAPEGQAPPPPERRVEREPGRVDQVHEPHPTYDFALCHAPAGSHFLFDDRPAVLTSARELAWTNGEAKSARELTILPEAGKPKHIYATTVRDRWQYYEERPLERDERELLGFDGAAAPPSLRNGDDRYYPDTPQSGTRSDMGHSETIEQHLYLSSRASTQFRAVRGVSGQWTVFVQEPIDGSHFEAAN